MSYFVRPVEGSFLKVEPVRCVVKRFLYHTPGRTGSIGRTETILYHSKNHRFDLEKFHTKNRFDRSRVFRKSFTT